MISKYKYILLDVDGVILSSINYYTELFRDVSESHGAQNDVSDDFYKSHIGVELDKWVPKILPKENHHKFEIAFLERINNPVGEQNIPLIDGVGETLEMIKNGNKKIAFISTKPRKAMNSMLQRYSLHEFIDFSIAGDEVTKYKPDPEGIIKSLDYFKANKEEALFIGDSKHDLVAAQNASINFIGVLTGICTSEDWEFESVPYIPSLSFLTQSTI
jgi:phosphoglycolate phosphatase